jgi:hypothetical protein
LAKAKAATKVEFEDDAFYGRDGRAIVRAHFYKATDTYTFYVLPDSAADKESSKLARILLNIPRSPPRTPDLRGCVVCDITLKSAPGELGAYYIVDVRGWTTNAGYFPAWYF